MSQSCPICGGEMKKVVVRLRNTNTELDRVQSVREYFDAVTKAFNKHISYWICPVDNAVIEIG